MQLSMGTTQFIDVFERGDLMAAKDLITEHIVSGKDRILSQQE